MKPTPLPSTVEGMHALYTKTGLITFGVSLGKYWHAKKQIFKKEVFPPDGFQKFTIDTIPPLRHMDNALGMLCGKPNGIFALDIDEPSALDDLLQICGKEMSDLPPDLPVQESPRGLHLIFAYDERLDAVNGRSCVIRDHKELPIDTRTTTNFIYVAPSSYKDADVDWHYHWRDDYFPYKDGRQPPKMPDWLFDQLIKGDEKTIRTGTTTRLLQKTRPTLADQQQAQQTQRRASSSPGLSQPFQMRYNQYMNAAKNILTPKVFNDRQKKPQQKIKTSAAAVVDQI